MVDLMSSRGPVGFRGDDLCLAKAVDEGGTSAHPVSSSEAWGRMGPFLKKTGVTRVSDITQLDRIGIPVFNVLRPSLGSYTAAHGKGFTATAARLSAAGESLERWFGTSPDIPSFRATWNELAQSYPMISPEQMAPTPHSFFHKDLEIPWALGWDLVSQEEVPLPLELVRLSPGGDDKGLMDLSQGLLFQCSSNGLACGVHLLEAVSQSLLEVIERDSVTCCTMASRAAGLAGPVFRTARPESIPFSKVHQLLARIRSAGLEFILADNGTDVGVPTWNCYLFDMKEPLSVASVSHGMGSSLDHETAMTRAVTEAVQARCVFLSGVRDIVPSKEFGRSASNDSRRSFNALKDAIAEEADLSNLEDQILGTFEEDVHECLRRLGLVGLDRAIVFRLSTEEDPVQVAKVFVPGAEGYIFPYYKPGFRAISAMRHVLKEGSPLFREEGFSW